MRHRALKAYAPGAYRKERKVLDAGALVEVELDRLINTKRPHQERDIASWRRPGIKGMRLTGVRYIPDAAGYVPELEQHGVPTQAPDIKGRNEFNVIFEFKGQHKTGSAEKKIFAAIVDLAHLCDERKTVGAVILDTPVLTDQQIIALKAEGMMHAVAVMTAREVRAGLLVPELVRIAKVRRRLRHRVSEKGRYQPSKRPSRAEKTLAYRLTQRDMMHQSLRKYGKSGLLR